VADEALRRSSPRGTA